MRNALRRLTRRTESDSAIEAKGRGVPIRQLALLFVAILSLLIGCFALAQNPPAGQEKPDTIAAEDSEACMACHSDAQDGSRHVQAVTKDTLAKSPHKGMSCQDCHSMITGAPHTPDMLKEKANCGSCHTDVESLYLMGAHSKKDQAHGDHPSCVFCHGEGNAHAIQPAAAMTRPAKAKLCSECHREAERMTRYGVDSDAVPSYEDSFHGKALIRFHATNTAVCTDCHQTHSVLAPSDERATTNRKNAAATCSQPACHPGARESFAMSGANHLRLKIKDDFILQAIDMFFRVLVVSVVLFLMGGIALDLRKKVFGKEPPRCGRITSAFIGLGFISAATSLLLGVMDQGYYGRRGLLVAVGMIVLAYISYFIKRPKVQYAVNERMYERLTKSQIWQHALFAVFFVLLISTGLPLKFHSVPSLQRFYTAIGGLSVAREVHRVAAIGMICVWIWHLTFLIIRWKRHGFSIKSMTMLPTMKDVKDFIGTTRYYLGLSESDPHYGRFQFRQKLDYVAEYWGIPVMVLSGFILWFPIYWGNRLPEEALSVAIVAHGWEATLAFLAIVLWHLYNEYFSPDAFPMNVSWITGKMSRSQMEREHPLELRELDAQQEPSAE